MLKGLVWWVRYKSWLYSLGRTPTFHKHIVLICSTCLISSDELVHKNHLIPNERGNNEMVFDRLLHSLDKLVYSMHNIVGNVINFVVCMINDENIIWITWDKDWTIGMGYNTFYLKLW